jgi:mannobiose 2-epimerase
MIEQLRQYRAEVSSELESILNYWIENARDEVRGGFIGRITHDHVKQPDAPRGSVLNSRILWSFSAAFNLNRESHYLLMARHAFEYFCQHFIDHEYGGVYWTVTADGPALDTKKQIYALSFSIYGLSEYYIASGDDTARDAAIRLYHDIVDHSYDSRFGGYVEALGRDWTSIENLRLSAKDANERKSMNTHLHVLEGFANLYRIWPDEALKNKLNELIQYFLKHIIINDTHHLQLFFDDDWTPKSDLISYGHDVEAAWVIQDAAAILGDDKLLQQVKIYSLKIAEAAARGLDKDGGLWYEYNMPTKHLVGEKHWWPQAEAMVGFFNAWQSTGDLIWFNRSLQSWDFVKRYLKDKSGEWHWGIREDLSLMDGEDKVGIWKCPYHNSRACMEIIRRIDVLDKKDKLIH